MPCVHQCCEDGSRPPGLWFFPMSVLAMGLPTSSYTIGLLHVHLPPLYSHLCLEIPQQICLLPLNTRSHACALPALSLLCGAVRVLCGWVDPHVSHEEHMFSSWWFMRSMFMLMVRHHQQVRGALYTSSFILPLPKAGDPRSAEERELTRCRNELVSIH